MAWHTPPLVTWATLMVRRARELDGNLSVWPWHLTCVRVLHCINSGHCGGTELPSHCQRLQQPVVRPFLWSTCVHVCGAACVRLIGNSVPHCSVQADTPSRGASGLMLDSTRPCWTLETASCSGSSWCFSDSVSQRWWHSTKPITLPPRTTP